VLRRRLAPDLADLAVAVAHQPLHIAPQMLVQQLDLLMGPGLAERGSVENLPLGALRREDLTDLGDGGLLGIGERAITDVGLLVLLLEALHCQLERALGGVVRHRPQCSRLSGAARWFHVGSNREAVRYRTATRSIQLQRFAPGSWLSSSRS